MPQDANDYQKKFVDRVKEAVAHRGVSWRVLEARAGVGHGTFYNIIKRGTLPNVEIAAKLISVTGCSARWLLLGVGPMIEAGEADARDELACLVGHLNQLRPAGVSVEIRDMSRSGTSVGESVSEYSARIVERMQGHYMEPTIKHGARVYIRPPRENENLLPGTLVAYKKESGGPAAFGRIIQAGSNYYIMPDRLSEDSQAHPLKKSTRIIGIVTSVMTDLQGESGAGRFPDEDVFVHRIDTPPAEPGERWKVNLLGPLVDDPKGSETP